MNSDIVIMLWVFLPAMISNASAMLSRFVPKNKYLDMPVDFGKSWRSKRILGDGKTIKGFVIGTLLGIFVAVVQISFKPVTNLTEQIYPAYLDFNPILWGFLAGFGALLGDSIESFFKRRIGIPRGESWVPFDQIDYALGAIALTALYKQFDLWFYIQLIILFVLMHVISRTIWSVTGMDSYSKKKDLGDTTVK